jgi:hypothetical protein
MYLISSIHPLPEPGAIYVMDRGYLDFERLYALHQAPTFFVIRSKSKAIHAFKNMNENRRSENESPICLKITPILAEVKNPCRTVTFLIEINPIHGAFASMTLLYSPFCLSLYCVPSLTTIHAY